MWCPKMRCNEEIAEDICNTLNNLIKKYDLTICKTCDDVISPMCITWPSKYDYIKDERIQEYGHMDINVEHSVDMPFYKELLQ